MSGNLCRCGAYTGIVEAIRETFHEEGAMKNFSYASAETIGAALQSIARSSNAKFLAGGTNLVNLMRENIEQPDHLVDVTRLPLAQVALIPAYIGIALVFGFPQGESTAASGRILTFLVAVGVIVISSLVTFAVLGVRGKPLARFIEGSAAE